VPSGVVLPITDVRLCRFIDILLPLTAPPPPAAACVTLTRVLLDGTPPPLAVLDNNEPDCERGRDIDDAILGSAVPLRELLLGLPEARFLKTFEKPLRR
jgi:hypothetical protein